MVQAMRLATGTGTSGIRLGTTRHAKKPHSWVTDTQVRLVIVGAASALDRSGYLACTACRRSVSPLLSDRQCDQGEQSRDERCGRKVVPSGFNVEEVDGRGYRRRSSSAPNAAHQARA
jgi:hypothetical protein